jgi:AAA+ superfamily predicted ATPase
MAPDPELLRAMAAAVENDPQNAALRVHLAELLLDSGRPADALAHLEHALRDHPDHVDALGLAARAGSAVGDPRASGWARLHASLGGNTATSSTNAKDVADHGFGAAGTAGGSDGEPPTPHVHAEDGTDHGSEPTEAHDWDQFLREILLEAGPLQTVTLADVGGLNDVKQRLEQSFLTPLRNPELRRTYGAHLRGGLLLWGPPGCGKTFLARAVAGELGAQFVSVGLHNVLDMWLGNSEKQLHQLFELARRNPPCVLFFDELDAIGHSRMNLSRSAARNVVAQLLVELDGVDDSNEGIFVIGATNQPWDVDPGLRRPGRFDRTMLVLPPDAQARAAILRTHLENRPLGDVDIDELATRAEGLSGADLRLVCDDAAELALADAIRTGSTQPITAVHLRRALQSVKPSTSAWFESARNHVRYANQDGQYDELAVYLKSYRAR